jgi:lipopolysaccharide transport system permease protein
LTDTTGYRVGRSVLRTDHCFFKRQYRANLLKLKASKMRHRYFQLILYKTYADLRAEAARTYIGIFWWVLEPLLYMSVFYVVFGIVIQRGIEDFAPFLLCGLVTWKWFDGSLRQGCNAILINSGLIRQVYLPKYILPTVTILVLTVKFAVVFALLLLFLVVYGFEPGWSWLALPAILLTQLAFIAGCTLLAAAVVPFVPDLRVLIDNGLMLLFFLSGVFFDLSSASEEIRLFLELNPMAVLINEYRQVLMHGQMPSWGAVAVIVGVSVLLAGFGLYLLKRLDRRYPKVLMR